jgi:hypothetical protein
MYSECTFLTLEKTKKNKLFLWGYFDIFIRVFCVINRFMGAFWHFSRCLSNFLFRNLVAHLPNVPASWWCLRHLGGVCNTIRWPNLAIRCLTRYAIVSSSTWCAVCGRIFVGGHLFYFFLSFLITVHNCPLCCLIFNFSPHSFTFYFIFIPFIEVFFQLSPSIIISHMFYFSFMSSFF